MNKRPTIHLIGNAHLDPVWLWDWREGLNEGIITCQTLVKLLKEFPEATLIRGEVSIYEYIERHDPKLFSEIRTLVDQGRWDVVGGVYVQPDTNMPGTEPLLRQFIRGKRYFKQKLGVDVKVGWAADSFGHSAGLPEILAAAGMESMAFTRPLSKDNPVEKPAFWWEAPSGAKVLSYRPNETNYYCIARDDMESRLDECLVEIEKSGLQNVACFYGLGNHGGGPTRVHLRAIEKWAKLHPEVNVLHSGLHRLFKDLRTEEKSNGKGYLPTVKGELNFCLRGCSASMAKFKFLYRKTEARTARAEKACAAASALVKAETKPLDAAWDSLLFNAFHDILPGTSIERAFDDQIAQTSGALADVERAETHALFDLSSKVDTRWNGWSIGKDEPTPVPVMLWNPHPREFKSQVEIEVSLDYRPFLDTPNRPDVVPVALREADGTLIPHQVIAEDHDSMQDLTWRRRIVVPMTLPALGWKVVHMGLAPKMPVPPKNNSVKSIGDYGITNGKLSVIALPGESSINFEKNGKPWLAEGLSMRTWDDPFGVWGGMNEEKDSWLLTHQLEHWKIERVKVLESGPNRAALWVRLSGAKSRIDLTFQLAKATQHITVLARVLWDNPGARLKLALPAGGAADYEVPGGIAQRHPCGEVPGGRWVIAGKGKNRVGFASDSLYGFDTTDKEFQASIVRSPRYASDVPRPSFDSPWIPASDLGEHRFKFIIDSGLTRLDELAAELEEAPVQMPVPPHSGKLPPSGAILDGIENGLKLLALERLNPRRFILRIHNTSAVDTTPTIQWLGQSISLGSIKAGQIVTWRLKKSKAQWKALQQDATLPIS